MASIRKSVNYIGTDADYTQISQALATYNFGPTVHTVYITNGWHTGQESRLVALGNGAFRTQLMTVWYFGYCVNVDGSAKIHWYAN